MKLKNANFNVFLQVAHCEMLIVILNISFMKAKQIHVLSKLLKR